MGQTAYAYKHRLRLIPRIHLEYWTIYYVRIVMITSHSMTSSPRVFLFPSTYMYASIDIYIYMSLCFLYNPSFFFFVIVAVVIMIIDEPMYEYMCIDK